MQQALIALTEAIEKLPSDGPCSLSKGALEFYEFIRIYSNTLGMVQEILAENDQREKPGEKRSRAAWETTSGEKIRPWNFQSFSVWEACRRRWRHTIALHQATLAYEYIIDNRNYHPLSLCFALYAQICECLVHWLPQDVKRSYQSYSLPEELVYSDLLVVRPEDGATGVNISDWSVTVLLNHVYWMMTRFNDLVYTPKLETHCAFLELRAARLLTCLGNSFHHNSEAYRREEVPADPRNNAVTNALMPRFRANGAFLQLCAFTFSAFWERFRLARLIHFAPSLESMGLAAPYNSSERRSSVEEQQRRARELRKWYRNRALACTTLIPSDWIRKNYPEECVWPGERQLYALSHSSDAASISSATNALTIIKTNRTTDVKNAAVNPLLLLSRETHYNEIIAQASTPTPTVISSAFDALGNGPQRESLILSLCLYEHMCNCISERYGSRFQWSRFCIMRRNLQMSSAVLRSTAEDTMPYVVQAFNHFGLVYRGKMWQFDNYIESVCAWFSILEHAHNYMISPTLSIREFAEEIFFQERVKRRVDERLQNAARGSKHVFDL